MSAKFTMPSEADVAGAQKLFNFLEVRLLDNTQRLVSHAEFLRAQRVFTAASAFVAALPYLHVLLDARVTSDVERAVARENLREIIARFEP